MSYFLRAVFFFTLLILFRNCVEPNQKNKNDVVFNACYLQYENIKNGEADSIVILLNKVDSLSLLYQDDRLYWLSNHLKGNLFSRISEYKTSQDYYLKAQKSVRLRPDLDTLVSKSDVGIAQTYKNTGNYPEAIQANLRALTVYEKHRLTASVNRVKVNIANIFLLKGDFNQAKQWFRDIVKNNFTVDNAVSYHLLANLYGELGQIDSALLIDDNMITHLSSVKHLILLSPFYNNKATCFFTLQKTDSALVYFKKSYRIDSIIHDKKNMGVNLIALADIYAYKGDKMLAIQTYQGAISLLKQYNIKRELRGCYMQMYSFFKTQKDYKTAMLYGDSANAIEQQINNMTLNTKMGVLQIEYETNKKDELIKTQNQKLHQQELMALIAALILVLMGTTIYFIYKTKQAKQTHKQQLHVNKAVFEAENQERERIARDLHDNMGAYTTSLLAQIDSIESNLPAHYQPEIKELRVNAESIMSTLRETVWILKTKTVSGQQFFFFLKTYTDKQLLKNASIKVTYIEDITTVQYLNPSVSLNLYRIVQEIIQNIIKHANATQVSFTLYSNKRIVLEIVDNGIGFDMNQVNWNSGLGNMRYRANEINFDISIHSEIKQGTVVRVEEKTKA
ncbi:MAG: hypothetical protein JST67_08550 [Bacteroidetes bacterium]|nr:hypothetical protein [Bacteroidota bacterium]